MSNELLGYGLFGGFFAIVIGGIVFHHLKIAAKRAENYEWYLNEHPAALRNGRVHCHKCDCSRLSVQRLMNKTYLRAHVCTQCGTTLYHSKE